MIETAGIPTVSISLLREITERVAPPRVLYVDRPLGFPLGRANDEPLQRRILMSALEMLSVEISGPFLRVFADESPDAV